MNLNNIGFIGGGNMATAIINGLEKSYKDIAIHVCDAMPAQREKHSAAGRQAYACIDELCKASSVIILAVKPQNFSDIMAELAAAISNQLVISILAGVTLAQIESSLPNGTHVIRTMPNTPMAIGQGMVGIAPGNHAGKEDLERAQDIFSVSAKTITVDESKINAITAVSGSGPAYFFHFCEALQSAAESLGFSPDEARLLVSQTAQGSINYLCSQDGFPAATLREQVTSKGGTTAAALDVFAEHDLMKICKDALVAAERRGDELSKQV